MDVYMVLWWYLGDDYHINLEPLPSGRCRIQKIHVDMRKFCFRTKCAQLVNNIEIIYYIISIATILYYFYGQQSYFLELVIIFFIIQLKLPKLPRREFIDREEHGGPELVLSIIGEAGASRQLPMAHCYGYEGH